MTDWEERISEQTTPAIRVEHDLRYRLAAPLIRESSAWADLGCGNGTAAADALGGGFRGCAILVDIDPAVVATAASRLAGGDIVELSGDLASAQALDGVSAALLSVEGDRIVTCFEVVEHLETFAPLIEWAVRLALNGEATFIMSVPNDAFWAIQNPYHRTTWGAGAFDELRRLLPTDCVVFHQLALSGSAICSAGSAPHDEPLTVHLDPTATAATHFIAAIGPGAAKLAGGAEVAQADPVAQRKFERKREADLAYLVELLDTAQGDNEQLLAQVRELTARLRDDIQEFDDWRAYIRRLEAQLGIPPPAEDDAPAAAIQASATNDARHQTAADANSQRPNRSA